MRTHLASLVLAAVLACAGLAVLHVATADAATPSRPGSTLQLFQQLNGQPSRWIMPDGGMSGIFAGTSGGCMPVLGGTVQGPPGAGVWSFTPSTLLVVATGPINLCVRPSGPSQRWDGGCNTTDTDENFGVPLQANVPQYITIDPYSQTICAATDAGFVRMPVWATQ